MDNPNQIMCRCRIGYGIDKIRRIWIIHKFYADYLMFKIGYPIICLHRLKTRGQIHNLEKKIVRCELLFGDMVVLCSNFWIENFLTVITYWLIIYHLSVGTLLSVARTIYSLLFTLYYILPLLQKHVVLEKN